jgi:20S proteasome alpha/beta subunit
MTVCIAVACESGKNIVVAADRMLTYPPPVNLEFETEEKKIEPLSDSCVAMGSGDTSNITTIIRAVKERIGSQGSVAVAAVAPLAQESYVSQRNSKFYEVFVMAQLGLDFKRFSANGMSLPVYLQAQPMVFQQVTIASMNFQFREELIIAGIDGSGAHVYAIQPPGTTVVLDKMGYGAIGSGAIHALTYLSLRGQTVHRGLADTLYNVYVAKKTAESAPGVGPGTDLAIINQKTVNYLSGSVLKALEELQVESSGHTPKTDKLIEMLGGV